MSSKARQRTGLSDLLACRVATWTCSLISSKQRQQWQQQQQSSTGSNLKSPDLEQCQAADSDVHQFCGDMQWLRSREMGHLHGQAANSKELFKCRQGKYTVTTTACNAKEFNRLPCLEVELLQQQAFWQMLGKIGSCLYVYTFIIVYIYTQYTNIVSFLFVID